MIDMIIKDTDINSILKLILCNIVTANSWLCKHVMFPKDLQKKSSNCIIN